MRRTVAMTLALALVAAACGGSDDGGSDGGDLSGSEQALATAIEEAIMEDSASDPESPFGREEARCMGQSTVREIGVDGLGEMGITPETPDPGDAFERASDTQIDAVIDVFLNCVDMTEFFIEGLAETGAPIGDDAARCLADQFQQGDFLKSLMRASLRGDELDFEGDPEFATQIITMMLACFSPEELAELGTS